MSEWWTYGPSDFLMFAPRTYYRLFEIYNAEIWPAQIVALAAAAALLVLLYGGAPWHGRAALAIFGCAWGWVAWGFLLRHYDGINWAGRYMAAAFAAEALLLGAAGLGVGRPRLRAPGTAAFRVGIGLLLLAALYPAIGLALGRRWQAVEILGLAPDPTAIGTLGLLLLTLGRVRWLLAVIPLAWCALTGVTLGTMRAPDALIAPAAGLVFLAACWWRGGAERHGGQVT